MVLNKYVKIIGGRDYKKDGLLTVEESFFFFGQFGVLLAAKSLGVVRFIPLSEWGRIDGNDGTLDQGLGTDQFVVRGVVDNIDDTDFSCNGFGSPGEVA